MHKHRNKRRLRIQLTFVYTLMGLAIVSILTILVLVIQGYRYNRFDGKVEQGGLKKVETFHEMVKQYKPKKSPKTD